MESLRWWVFVISFISCFCFFLYYYMKLRQKKHLRDRYFSFYSHHKEEYFENLRKKLHIINHIETLLKNTKSKMNLQQFFLVSLLCMIFGVTVGSFLMNDFLVGIIVGITVGVIPYIRLLNAERKRIREITIHFGPMLNHMANYLRAGNNLLQAIEKTALITEGALGEILEEVVRRIDAGESINRALDAVYENAPLVEFKMFHILINIHRDMGGDLAHSLENLADIIEEKKILRSEIDSLTQETRISAYITAIVPTVLYIGMRFASPEYMKQIEKLPFGKIGLALSFGFILVGVFVVKKMSDIKVDKAYR